MKKPTKRLKKRSEMTLDEKAEASLRKRGLVWWTHFGLNGHFFRFSLGTSDKAKAQRRAKKLIALAKAGKIAAVASSPEERAARQSVSAKNTATDPKVSAAAKRRNRKRWKKASKKDRRTHGDAIRAGLTPEILLERSKTTTDLWKDDDYAESHKKASKEYWSKKSHRKAQSRRQLAAGEKLKVQENRRKGRLKAARNLLRRRGLLKNPRQRGAHSTPVQEKEFFKVGLGVETLIPPALRKDKAAIEAARDAYCAHVRPNLPRGLCGTYHRRFRAILKSNPSFAPPFVPLHASR
jgi:hypothetical protein